MNTANKVYKYLNPNLTILIDLGYLIKIFLSLRSLKSLESQSSFVTISRTESFLYTLIMSAAVAAALNLFCQIVMVYNCFCINLKSQDYLKLSMPVLSMLFSPLVFFFEHTS